MQFSDQQTNHILCNNLSFSHLQHTQSITCHSIFQVDMVYILLSLLILYHCYMYPEDMIPNYPQYLLGSNNPQDMGRWWNHSHNTCNLDEGTQAIKTTKLILETFSEQKNNNESKSMEILIFKTISFNWILFIVALIWNLST